MMCAGDSCAGDALSLFFLSCQNHKLKFPNENHDYAYMMIMYNGIVV